MTGPGTSDRSAAAPTDDQVTAVPVAPGGADAPSPRLYNRDLAPTTVEGRSWKAYNIFTLWAVDVHSLGNYGFALGLFALGLGAWQILVSLGIGALVLFVLLTVAGYMGYRTVIRTDPLQGDADHCPASGKSWGARMMSWLGLEGSS